MESVITFLEANPLITGALAVVVVALLNRIASKFYLSTREDQFDLQLREHMLKTQNALEESKRELTQRIRVLEKENTQLRHDYNMSTEKSASKVTHLETMVESLQQELSKLQHRLSQKDDTIGQLQRQLDQFRLLTIDHDSLVTELENEKKRLEIKITELLAEIERLLLESQENSPPHDDNTEQ